MKALAWKPTPRQFHITATLVWAVLFFPTVLWWKESIKWLAIMSCYANFIGHWSAYQASRAEEASGRR